MDENQSLHIDAKAFMRFALGKNLNMRCPICSMIDFTLVTTTPGRSLVVLDIEMKSVDLANLHALEVMSVECDNCGSERLFKRDHIARWLRANP
jgi:hypothetical protein